MHENRVNFLDFIDEMDFVYVNDSSLGWIKATTFCEVGVDENAYVFIQQDKSPILTRVIAFSGEIKEDMMQKPSSRRDYVVLKPPLSTVAQQ